MKKNDDIYHVERLIRYCKKTLGYNVIIKNKIGNEVKISTKEILLTRSQTDMFLLYSFLHEIGHVLLINKPNYKKRYNMAIASNMTEKEETAIHKKSSKKLTYRVSVLKEELDAWDEGLKLAKKKRIPINDKKWRELMSLCIKGYANFVVDEKNGY